MFKKSLALVGLLVITISSNAAVVNVDWLTAGDNLITHDDVSGLNWLDVTETTGMSYDYVTGQFGTTGIFNGFRYATNAEVAGLWSNFGMDLSAIPPGPVPGPADPGIAAAATYLGDTFTTITGRSGTLGLTDEAPMPDLHMFMGAYTIASSGWSDIFTSIPSNNMVWDDTDAPAYVGSYLVQVNAVPVPAAAWLFGSALIGLASIKRKK